MLCEGISVGSRVSHPCSWHREVAVGSGGREMSCATTRAGVETTVRVCVRLSPLEVCASSAPQTSKFMLMAVKPPNVPKSSAFGSVCDFLLHFFSLGAYFSWRVSMWICMLSDVVNGTVFVHSTWDIAVFLLVQRQNASITSEVRYIKHKAALLHQPGQPLKKHIKGRKSSHAKPLGSTTAHRVT